MAELSDIGANEANELTCARDEVKPETDWDDDDDDVGEMNHAIYYVLVSQRLCTSACLVRARAYLKKQMSELHRIFTRRRSHSLIDRVSCPTYLSLEQSPGPLPAGMIRQRFISMLPPT